MPQTFGLAKTSVLLDHLKGQARGRKVKNKMVNESFSGGFYKVPLHSSDLLIQSAWTAWKDFFELINDHHINGTLLTIPS